eukprot:SAG11_NODE_27382_length_333_cov_0.880342_1_plen_48_part_10
MRVGNTGRSGEAENSRAQRGVSSGCVYKQAGWLAMLHLDHALREHGGI